MHECPLCSGSGAVTFPIAYTLKGSGFRAVRCTSCSFVYVVPRPTDADLAVMYSDEYFLFDGASFGAHASTDYETAARQGAVKFPVILGHIGRYKPSGSFFEVGCGMGYFLDYARAHGYEVSGIEYSALGAEKCRTMFGLDVRQSSLESYDARGKQFDVIFLGDVLEHLVDPLGMARKCRSMLAPGGILALEIPSMFNSIVGRLAVHLFRMAGHVKQMPMPPYHVNEFVPATLRRLFARSGFEDVTIIQRIKRPSTITLRGAFYERWGKLLLQYPNFMVTSAFGVFGDRLLGIGRNPAHTGSA